MIWFILYPLRRTTKSPVLSPDSYVRLAFQAYGKLVARHWLLFIVLSVAAAVTLCYPSIFLYSNPASGFSHVPRHVWSSAKVFGSGPQPDPDLEVRQLWVHGNYMKALEKEVILQALKIQSALVEHNGVPPRDSGRLDDESSSQQLACGSYQSQPLTWGLHSPLIFWECSEAAVKTDPDLLGTINTRSGSRSFLNVTVSARSVLAGEDRKRGNITAADALVITLFDLPGSTTGQTWDKTVQVLSRDPLAKEKWFLPSGGSQLYQFEFKELSLQDGFLLFLSYSAMAIYVLASLRKTPALKSSLGLGFAIITELSVSVISSFTICGILNVDLTRIPGEVYPFVVLTVGLENMFYLMNEVISSSATLPTVQRISLALGEVGLTSLSVALQNLFVLYVLSFVVAPSVRAFCVFAAIALVLEYILHLTFFLAVLSVDVQRLELQDSLERTTPKQDQTTSSSQDRGRQTWLNALRHGKLPFSTRIAGTAVSICFILALNWHFFDNITVMDMLRSVSGTGSHQSGYVFPSSVDPPFEQRTTPTAWMRSQEHTSAKELLQLIKLPRPGFAARIHQPVAVILDGADRAKVATQPDDLLSIIESVLNEHLIPWSLAVVLIVGLTTILMNYLLWDGSREDDLGYVHQASDGSMQLHRLYRNHEHDIVKLHTCGRHIVSIASDGSIAVQLWDATKLTYKPYIIRTEYLAGPVWPITSIAMNRLGTWLAFASACGRIVACKLSNRRLKEISKLPPSEDAPVLFEFMPHTRPNLTSESAPVENLICLMRDGLLADIRLSEGTSASANKILDEGATFAVPLNSSVIGSRFIAASGQSNLVDVRKGDRGWEAKEIGGIGDGTATGPFLATIRDVVRASSVGMYAIASTETVVLLDQADDALIAFIELERPLESGSLRLLHSPRRLCETCRAVTIATFALAYTDATSQDSVLLVLCPSSEQDGTFMCMVPKIEQRRVSCSRLSDASVRMFATSNPGSWEATDSQSLIGIRFAEASDNDESETLQGPRKLQVSSTASNDVLVASKVRSRRQSRAKQRTPMPPRSHSTENLEDYEVWCLSTTGEFHVQPLGSLKTQVYDAYTSTNPGRGSEYESLFAGRLGPIKKLGSRSVVIAIANTIVLVSLGSEAGWGATLFDEDATAFGAGEISSRRSREKARKREE